MSDREQWRDQIAKELAYRQQTPVWLENEDCRKLAQSLLPVVAGIVADELRAAADAMTWPNSQNCGPGLRARADRIDPPS